MFPRDAILKLSETHGDSFRELAEIETALNERFADMSNPIHCLMLSVASGEAMLLVGPPGTAKSRLIRAFCHLVGLLEDSELEDATQASGKEKYFFHNEEYFEYLLTPFTEPSELFGYFDLAKLHKDHELERADQGMMQHARVVFIDEVFNASSAILNSLLTFMNERKFHDRGRGLKVPLQCLFSATNQVPKSDELRAIFDRFLFRCWIENEPAVPEKLNNLLAAGWSETHAPPQVDEAGEGAKSYPDLLDSLIKLRQDIDRLSRSDELQIERGQGEFFQALANLVESVRKAGLSQMSNRRLVKFAKVMLVNRLYEMAKDRTNGKEDSLQFEDRMLLVRYGLDQPSTSFEERIRRDPTGF